MTFYTQAALIGLSQGLFTQEDERRLKARLASTSEAIVAFTTSDGLEKCIVEHECETCVTKPEVVVNERFTASDCDESDGVRACIKTLRTVQFPKRVKICHERMRKKCDSPCFDCPTYCRPNKQYWCEDDFKVTEEIGEDIICSKESDSNKVISNLVGDRVTACEGEAVRIRTRSQNLDSSMRCYERELDGQSLCAPVNCRFEEQGSACMETLKIINVRNKHVEICMCSKCVFHASGDVGVVDVRSLRIRFRGANRPTKSVQKVYCAKLRRKSGRMDSKVR